MRSITSPPVSPGQSVTSPGTLARRRCNTTASRQGSPPRSLASPESLRIRPSRTRSVVDLPAPLGPRKPCTSPLFTERSSPSNARVLPKVLTSPDTEMTLLSFISHSPHVPVGDRRLWLFLHSTTIL